MDTHIARQPIFNSEEKIFGYELLFRNGLDNAMPGEIDGDAATSKLLSSSFFTIGIDTLTNGKYAFINFTQKLITSRIPKLFPPSHTVIEVLEDVLASPDVIEALQSARKSGYTVALDDFILTEETRPLLEAADIIKVDLLATPLSDIDELMEAAKDKKITLLAEKVETPEVFLKAKEMGFSLFQGYFFCRPELISGKEIPASTVTLLQLVAEVNRPKVDYDTLERLIARDLSLVHKLLSRLNSAWYGLKNPVHSLGEALHMVGIDEIRRLVGLVAMARIASSAPEELVRTSLVRARLCELIAQNSPLAPLAPTLYALGLFSLLDALLAKPMDEILKDLPLPEVLTEALSNGAGPLMPFLDFVRAYEQGAWADLTHAASRIKLPKERIATVLVDTLTWANTFSDLKPLAS